MAFSDRHHQPLCKAVSLRQILQGCCLEIHKTIPLFFEELFFFYLAVLFREWKCLTCKTCVHFLPVSALTWTKLGTASLLCNKIVGRPMGLLPAHDPSTPVPAPLLWWQCPASAHWDSHYLYEKGAGCHLPTHSACINCACLLFIVTRHILCFCVTCH